MSNQELAQAQQRQRVEAIIDSNLSEINRLSNDLAEDLLDGVHKVLLLEDINFSGNLSASFEHVKDADNTHMVATNNPYAEIVDQGMPPGNRVNFDYLYNWVVKKLGITDKDDAREVTFKIQNKILSKGIAPTRFIKKSMYRVIGLRGIVPVKKTRIKQSRLTKALKRINKYVRKFNRGLRKINKVLKPVQDSYKHVQRYGKSQSSR